MAPSLTTNSSIPAPSAAVNDWTDFINTVGTSVGPLFTLFGELATKQFLSLSMGWADNILLALGPIGIITIVVSAIRTAGYHSLKTIIGRARESRTTAEQELLSSTSDEVCELWSGSQIVRVTGKPNNTKTLLVLRPGYISIKPTTDSVRVMSAAEACEEIPPLLSLDSLEKSDLQQIKEIASETPNLTLNVPGAIVEPRELWLCVLGGVLLQLAIIIISALGTYHWKWLRKGTPVSAYAYPCFVAGSVLIMVGALCCGHVIEGSTTEYTLKPSKYGAKRIRRILHVQMDCTVSSQHFPSVAIVNDRKERMRIRASRLNHTNYSCLTATASFAAVAGFVLQFIGLGALHWSATALVLLFTIIMTAVRAWLRRVLTKGPLCIPIPATIELVWVALRVVRNDWEVASTHEAYRPRDCEWGIVTGFKEPMIAPQESFFDDKHVHIRRTGSELQEWQDGIDYARHLSKFLETDPKFILGFTSKTYSTDKNAVSSSSEARAVTDLMSAATNIPSGNYADLASKLATAISGIMKFLAGNDRVQWTQSDVPPWQFKNWRIDVQKKLGEKTAWIVRTARDHHFKQFDPTKNLTTDLTAGLSLWLYSLDCGSKSMDPLYKEYRSMLARSMNRSDNDISDDWVEFDSLTPGTEEEFFRVVYSSRIKDALRICRWMGPMTRVRVPPENADFERCWPVFGQYYSGSFDMENIDHDEEQHQKAFTFRGPSSAGSSTDYVVVSNQTVELECALEILSLFMLSTCICMRRLEGNDLTYVNERIRHPLLEGLSKEVADAGLTESPEEALVYIVPAFERCKLLPDLSQPLQEEIAQKEREARANPYGYLRLRRGQA